MSGLFRLARPALGFRRWGSNSSVLTLATLSLSNTTFTFGSPTSVTILGTTAASSIEATGLPTGLTIDGTALDWDGTGTSATGNLALTETLAGASNSPRTSIIPYTIISTTLGTLSLSSTIFTVGSGASGTINGATPSSVISATSAPSGLTINSAARTWAWSGIGSATDSSFTLTETLSSAVNSPLDSTISYSIIVNDTTAPTLSSPTATESGSTTANIGVTTDEDNGTLYEVVTTSSTAPTKAQVKAGENNSGTAAVWSGSQVISSTGTKTATATGLTASTTYYAYFMHEDASGNQSDVAAAASFTTAAATGLGGSGTLSAPTLGYPSSQTAQPTLPYHAPVDWQSGDVAKIALSASADMSSPTILSHTLTDTDITNGAFSFPFPTLSGLTYFQAFGNDGTNDSQYLSNVVSWGDTTAPTITTSGTQSITETSQLAVALTATDTGGVPALVSDGTSPGWYLSGGADKLQFQIAIVSNVATLQWVGNGSETYDDGDGSNSKAADLSNDYQVQITAVDYSGNQSSPLSLTEGVTQIDRTPDAYSFTNVTNAAHSTLYTSNTVTISGLQPGFAIPSTFTGPGTYSQNGGAYVSTGSFTAQNGDTFTLQATSGSVDSMSLSLTLGIGLGSSTWSVATPGSSAVLTSTTGTGKSSRVNVASPYYQFILNAGIGAACLVRSNTSSVNTKHHLEWHIDNLHDTVYCGYGDGTTDFSGITTIVPGQSGGASGITIVVTATEIVARANGTVAFDHNALSFVAGDSIVLETDETAHTVDVWTVHLGTPTHVGTVTLTTQIPSTWWAFGGGNSGDATVANSDAMTFTPQTANWVMTPSTGFNNYYA